MVWIPTGLLKSGSAVDEVPRAADVEPPGVDVPLGGFYIDVLPWPNEAGAIPTTNVSQAEAVRLCEGAGKRLCSELEWERACKGPDNARYDYGPTYDAKACGGGQPADVAARHPSGDKAACRSGFGAREMHGGAWEWTDSPWSRTATGHKEAPYGALRGGDDAFGELVTRCAFARGMATASRSPSVGFRCCQGPRNEAEVAIEAKWGAAFERTVHPARATPPLDALGGTACGPPLAPRPARSARAHGRGGRRPTSSCSSAAAASGETPRRAARWRCGERWATAPTCSRRSTRAARSPRSCSSRGWTGASASGAPTDMAPSFARSSSATGGSRCGRYGEDQRRSRHIGLPSRITPPSAPIHA